VSNFPKKEYEYKPYPDSGQLRASTSKKTPQSPDYWGDLAINLKDLNAIKTQDGLTIFKLSGWKKQDKSGKTYLSIAIDRFVPTEVKAPVENKTGFDDMDSDVPF
jgi:hypothetical protein